MDFPECNDISVNDSVFNKLNYDRKSDAYRKAIKMAKLLLLNYHPDIRSGRNDVLALMFDMNKLWEAYVFKMLKKQLVGKFIVRAQVGANFWLPKGGRTIKIYPDIVIYDLSGENVITILDTKWKNISGNNRPSDDDLKQMFVYNLNYDCVHSALLYPSTSQSTVTGTYFINSHGSCSLVFLALVKEEESLKLQLFDLTEHVEKQHEQIINKML